MHGGGEGGGGAVGITFFKNRDNCAFSDGLFMVLRSIVYIKSDVKQLCNTWKKEEFKPRLLSDICADGRWPREGGCQITAFGKLQKLTDAGRKLCVSIGCVLYKH